jgi:arylsulfatase A-like enzyme
VTTWDTGTFLYFAHMHVHVPIYVPDRFMKESRNGLYGGAVSCIDWALGAIMHEVAALGLDDNTLVIFTSDNGARWTAKGGNSPLRGHKATTWEGGFRVPCIIRWPARITGNRVCRAVTTGMDFFPTLAALAGASVPDDRIIDGQDLSSLLFEERADDSLQRSLFYYKEDRLEAVRAGTWKLHVAKTAGRDFRLLRELYDLESDPGESNNLYTARPDIVETLMNELERCRDDLGDSVTNRIGRNLRPVGRVDDPEPMTAYDVHHPYMIDEYDLKDERT